MNSLLPYGLSFLPDADKTTKTAPEYYREAIQLCEMADQAGFSYVKMTEHYLNDYGGYCPSPLMFLTAVAARTQNIRLITGCLLPVFHHPIQLASEIALLDAISAGRIELGFARAYLPNEFEAFGISMNESRARFESTIAAVSRLLQEQAVSEHCPFFSYQNITILPEPVQKPRPPFWAAAVNSRQTFSWVGEQQFGLLVTPPFGDKDKFKENLSIYRESFLLNPSENRPKVALSIPLVIDENALRAKEKGLKYGEQYLKTWLKALKLWVGKTSSDYPGYDKIYHFLKDYSPEKMIQNDVMLCGDPVKVSEKIAEIKEEYGITYFLWQIDFGAQPYEVSSKSLDLFINQVAVHYAT